VHNNLTERVTHCARLVDYNITHHNLTATRFVRNSSAYYQVIHIYDSSESRTVRESLTIT